MQCPRCAQAKFRRISRRTLFHKFIAPLAGLYPWECLHCGLITLFKARKPAAAGDATAG